MSAELREIIREFNRESHCGLTLQEIDDLAERAAYHLATITARAEAAEAKVARVEALIDTWERSHSHLGIDRRYWGPSSSDLRAALAPAPTEGANGRQTGYSERVGTKGDA